MRSRGTETDKQLDRSEGASKFPVMVRISPGSEPIAFGISV